jgi:hypothetical protein
VVACGDPTSSNYFSLILRYFLLACSFFLTLSIWGFSVAGMANKEVEFPVWALIMCPSCGEELEYVGIRRKGKQIKLAWTHPEPGSGLLSF